MTRWKAAGVHLSISVLVAALVFAGMLFSWFPIAYFQASGAGRLLIILVSIDVVVGPLLTLLIFRAGKKGLGFDLSVIGLIQLAALVYGLQVMWLARPVFLVFSVDRFNLVFADQLPREELDLALLPEYQSLSWTGPRLAFARVPDDPDARSDLLVRSIELGRDIETMPAYFEPVAAGIEKIRNKGFELDGALPEAAKQQFERLAEKHDRMLGSMIGLPLIARGQPKTLVIDRQSATPVGVVDFDPWSY